MFSGIPMDGFEFTALHDCEQATRVDSTLPTREEDDFCFHFEDLKEHGIKARKNWWLDKINNQWEKYMYQEAFNWKNREVPAGMEAMLH